MGLEMVERGEARAVTALTVGPHHLNPHGVVHGAVVYALADQGMGAALYSLLGAGALNPVVIPVLSEYVQQESAEEFWRIVSIMLNFLIIALGGLTVVGIILAPQLLNLLAPGFDAATQHVAVRVCCHQGDGNGRIEGCCNSLVFSDRSLIDHMQCHRHIDRWSRWRTDPDDRKVITDTQTR